MAVWGQFLEQSGPRRQYIVSTVIVERGVAALGSVETCEMRRRGSSALFFAGAERPKMLRIAFHPAERNEKTPAHPRRLARLDVHVY